MQSNDLSALAELLGSAQDEDRLRDSQPMKPALTPSTLVPAKALAAAAAANKATASGTAAKPQKNSKDIWDISEVVASVDVDDGTNDSRKRPEFDIMLKQKVGSEDVFLGMSGVQNSTAHCDSMVIKIKLPGASLADIDLDVTEMQIRVTSSQYRLSTYLPQKVKHKEGKAQWDASEGTLTITIPLVPTDIFEKLGGGGM